MAPVGGTCVKSITPTKTRSSFTTRAAGNASASKSARVLVTLTAPGQADEPASDGVSGTVSRPASVRNTGPSTGASEGVSRAGSGTLSGPLSGGVSRPGSATISGPGSGPGSEAGSPARSSGSLGRSFPLVHRSTCGSSAWLRTTLTAHEDDNKTITQPLDGREVSA